jgi:N-acetyltransferase 10
MLLTPFDLKRLESYANNMLDYHVILDLMPCVANLYFQKRLGALNKGGDGRAGEGAIRLTAVQSSILLAIGLQRKPVEDLETELQLPVSQTLALFAKMIRKTSKRLIDIQKAAISAEMPQANPNTVSLALSSHIEGDNMITRITDNITAAMEEELDQAGTEVTNAMRERQREMLSALDLKR